MAGAGYKLFNTGDVLTAAQVNTYLMEQTVMVFADAAARTAALTGVVSEGMLSYLKSTKQVEVYNGSAWVASDDPNAIQNTIVDAKGDLITATASDVPARLAVGNNGETLVADSSTSTGLRWQGSQAAGRNAIINGAFDIWQRSTSAAIAAGSYVAADRWYTFRSVAGSTFSRQTASLTGFQYSGRIARDSGNTSTANISCGQSIESVNSIPFAGQTIVFSFWAKAGANYSATSSILRVRLLSSTTTDQNIVLNGGTTVIDQNATLTTSWQRFSYSASVGSTAVTLGTIFSYDPTGTAGAADNFEVTGVQVELGSVATPFTRAGGTLAGELAAARRYYQECQFTNGVAISATSAQIWIQHNGMRVAPSAVASAALKLTDASTSDFTQSSAGISIVANNADAGRYDVGSLSGMTTNRVANLINGGGKVQLSAEL